ncbi:MAG: hypothetical protein KF800_13750 [Lysobacter sp.]|nr:hypothetical protein [Lysobacter sp.]
MPFAEIACNFPVQLDRSTALVKAYIPQKSPVQAKFKSKQKLIRLDRRRQFIAVIWKHHCPVRHGMPVLEAWQARCIAGAVPSPGPRPKVMRVSFADWGMARTISGLNPQLNLRLINAISTDALAESMAQSRGLEQTILNVIDRNGSFLRQRIGGG